MKYTDITGSVTLVFKVQTDIRLYGEHETNESDYGPDDIKEMLIDQAVLDLIRGCDKIIQPHETDVSIDAYSYGDSDGNTLCEISHLKWDDLWGKDDE